MFSVYCALQACILSDLSQIQYQPGRKKFLNLLLKFESGIFIFEKERMFTPDITRVRRRTDGQMDMLRWMPKFDPA